MVGFLDTRDNLQYVFKKYELTNELGVTALSITFDRIQDGQSVGEYILSIPNNLYKAHQDLRKFYELLQAELGVSVDLPAIMDDELAFEGEELYDSDDLNAQVIGYVVQNNLAETVAPIEPAFLSASGKNSLKAWNNFYAYAQTKGLGEVALVLLNMAKDMGANVVLP